MQWKKVSGAERCRERVAIFISLESWGWCLHECGYKWPLFICWCGLVGASYCCILKCNAITHEHISNYIGTARVHASKRFLITVTWHCFIFHPYYLPRTQKHSPESLACSCRVKWHGRKLDEILSSGRTFHTCAEFGKFYTHGTRWYTESTGNHLSFHHWYW